MKAELGSGGRSQDPGAQGCCTWSYSGEHLRSACRKVRAKWAKGRKGGYEGDRALLLSALSLLLGTWDCPM